MNEPIGNFDYLDRISYVWKFLWTAIKEIVMGVCKDRIPAHKYCYAGIVSSLLLHLRFDQWAFGLFGKSSHLTGSVRSFLEYALLFSGWLVWGMVRVVERNSVLEKLKVAFEAAKLKCVGKYPALVEDIEVDEHLRCLKLKTHGITLSEFNAAREKLENVLNFSIVKMYQEDGDKSKIEILYTTKDLDKVALLENPEQYADGDIPIGLSHQGPIKVNIRDVAHILVAGQSGGGKSNFMKMASSIISSNNKEAQIIFLDFKGGMESSDLKSRLDNMHDNISYHEGSAASIAELTRLGTELATRLDTFKNLSVSDFDQYLKAQLKRSAGPFEKSTVTEKRTYIFIDEMAQLYSTEPGLDKEMVVKAKAAANRIARQGRAAGIHLIVATQKPDSSSFDQTVKSNLPGVLCFPMANQASSVAALGTKRAFELNPEIKGRAVWKFGPKLEEIQTYKFS